MTLLVWTGKGNARPGNALDSLQRHRNSLSFQASRALHVSWPDPGTKTDCSQLIQNAATPDGKRRVVDRPIQSSATETGTAPP